MQNGYPNPSTATTTIEGAKILTIADILGACINSENTAATPSSPAMPSPACSTLFQNTTAPGGAAPTDTLQAAVNMALYPSQNVTNLYSLVPPSGSSAYSGSLTTQPNDWTIAVSYTASAPLGFGVDPYTITTLDIDTSGRVWFPSDAPGAAGVAYFDPGSSSFSQLYPAPGIVRPEQVAIDINGYVWATDFQSPTVAGFPGANPASPVTFSIPGTTSLGVSVLDDNSLRVGVVNTSSGTPAIAEIAAGGGSYSLVPNSTPPGSQGYVAVSLAGDTVGGAGVAATEVNGNPAGAGSCSFSAQGGFAFANQSSVIRYPSGLAVDGGGNLWLADSATPDVQEVSPTNGSYVNGNNLAPNQVYTHGQNSGGTIVRPGGIAIDNTGNVWVSNIGCMAASCAPTPFVLSELIGAGVPTINPVAAQVVLNVSPGVEPSLMVSSGSMLP